MAYQIIVSKKVFRRIEKLPYAVQRRFDVLYEILKHEGASGPHAWMNYGKLSEKDECHCHLNRSYVPCWRHEKKTITIEVYYVGSREDAPYA